MELVEEKKLWGQLWAWLRPDKPLIIGLMLVMVINTVVAISAPIFLQNALDLLQRVYVRPPSDHEQQIITFSILYTFAMIMTFFTTMSQNLIVAKINARFIHRIRSDAYAKILRNKISFYDDSELGRLVSRIVNDTNELMGSANRFANAFSRLIILIGVLIIMFSYNVQLTLASIAITPILFVAVIMMRKFQRRVAKRWRKSLAIVNGNFGEVMSSISISKAFFREEENFKKFQVLNEETYQAAKIRGYAVFATGPIQDFLKHLGIIILLYVSSIYVAQGLNVTVVYLFILLQQYMFDPISTIARSYNQFQSAFAALERVYTIMADKEISEPTGGENRSSLVGKIEYRDLTFAYSTGPTVLKDINILIEPKQTVALVGMTGSGKTSIVALLMRFYGDYDGDILIDDVNIQDYNLDHLRREIGYVQQDVLLFSGTILDNLKIAKPDVTTEEVWNALDAVYAREFIETLPDGIHTIIREEGANLSQGQKQMISLARALLADPKILILDEFTSSLDLYTEAKIQQGIAQLLDNRTSIVIAHRLVTILSADKIIVISDGEIAESGTHLQLLANKGKYADVYNKYFSFQISALKPKIKK